MSRSALRQCFYPLGLSSCPFAVRLQFSRVSRCLQTDYPARQYRFSGNGRSIETGMTRSQVQFVLGNPVLADSFERDRWNYVYTIDIPGQAIIERELIIVFEDDRLLRFEGDYTPSENKDDATAS